MELGGAGEWLSPSTSADSAVGVERCIHSLEGETQTVRVVSESMGSSEGQGEYRPHFTNE